MQVIVDADGHLDEEPDEIIALLDPPMNSLYLGRTHGLFPKPISLENRARGLLNGESVPAYRHDPTADKWVAFANKAHVEQTVLYPTAGLGIGAIQSGEVASILARGYNNWAFQKYTEFDRRLHCVALLPMQDPAEAVKELKRAKAPIVELSLEELRRVMEVNLFGSFYLAKAIAPVMIKQGSGSIIAIGGLSAISGTKNSTASAASKAGLLGLIRALAVELGPYGVRANMVVPGNIATEVDNPASHSDAERNVQESNNRSPLRRAGLPEEIASACAFLASEDASYITGEHLMCNGGRFID